MAKQKTIDKALGALYEVLAEGVRSYPDDEKAIRTAVDVLQRLSPNG